MDSFRELKVWQKSLQLVKCVYEETQLFPKEEIFGLKLQMRRCATSIPSNIAEGYGRQHTAEYVRFLQISRGSLNELITQFEIASSLDYLQDIGEIIKKCDEIGRMLNVLIRKLTRSTGK